MINWWWVHHCAGNLNPKSDPYSNEFEYPFEYVKPKTIITGFIVSILFSIIVGVTVWYNVHLFDYLADEYNNRNLLYLAIPSWLLCFIGECWIYLKILLKMT